MNLKQQIDSDLKQALLAGDKGKVTTLRGLKAAILDAEVSSGSREDGISNSEIEKIFQREAKKRRESIGLYRSNSRSDLADAEQAELDLIDAYLPKQLDEEELVAIVNDTISSMGGVSVKDMGRVIGAVKAKVGTSADGAFIAQVVKQKIG